MVRYKKTLKGLILSSVLLLMAVAVHAQQITVQGTVTDAQTGDPLVGVNILVVGTSSGTTTDTDGNYSLSVPSLQDSLRFSYIGFQTQTVAIDSRSTINIAMAPKVLSGKQMVVVGYGSQNKATLTGSVSSVSTKALKSAPVTNISNALAGRLPGVIMINGSGKPGSNGSTIRIRGNHSLNNNSPLIIINGVPDRSGRFQHMNPTNIKSISVLKDATAAIYGAEAANGVILVETKTGSKNQAPAVSLNIKQGFHQPTRIPDMANAPTYMTMLNELNRYKGLSPVYLQKDIQAYSNPNRDQWLYPETDWFNAVLKPISLQTIGNLSVEGGTSKLSYFISLGGKTNNGDYKHSATRYNQINFRSNIKVQISKNLNLTFNLSGRKEDRNDAPVSTARTFLMMMRGKPNSPAYFPNGKPGPDIEYGANPVVTGTTQTGYVRDQQYYLNGNVALDLTIPGFEGFDLKGMVSYNKNFENKKSWIHPWTLYSFDKQAYKNKGGGGRPNIC